MSIVSTVLLSTILTAAHVLLGHGFGPPMWFGFEACDSLLAGIGSMEPTKEPQGRSRLPSIFPGSASTVGSWCMSWSSEGFHGVSHASLHRPTFVGCGLLEWV